jgi:hypothetical protein
MDHRWNYNWEIDGETMSKERGKGELGGWGGRCSLMPAALMVLNNAVVVLFGYTFDCFKTNIIL